MFIRQRWPLGSMRAVIWHRLESRLGAVHGDEKGGDYCHRADLAAVLNGLIEATSNHR